MNLMNFIIKRYNNFDLLKIPISLSYKKEYLFKTFVGATLTIAAFFIILIYFIYKIIHLVKKTNFSIITNEYQSPTETINFKNIPILFSLTDEDSNPIQLNSKIYDFSVVFSNYIQHFDNYGNSNVTHVEQDIEIDKCDNIRDSLDLSLLDGYNISSFKCIKPGQDLVLRGIFGDIAGYQGFKINIKKCDNLTQNCYDNDYVELFFLIRDCLSYIWDIKPIFMIRTKKTQKKYFAQEVFPFLLFLIKEYFYT